MTREELWRTQAKNAMYIVKLEQYLTEYRMLLRKTVDRLWEDNCWTDPQLEELENFLLKHGDTP